MRAVAGRVTRTCQLLVMFWVLTALGNVGATGKDECESDTWCFPGVCVSGFCEPCTAAPGQCENHPSLTQAFCDQQSGDCWENTDCLPFVGNASAMACTPCTATGAMSCPWWEYCSEDLGQCTLIPGPLSCSD
jgi:hypothetical protein